LTQYQSAKKTAHMPFHAKFNSTIFMSSGIHKLKCNTCNQAYTGQSGRSITVRHKENVHYARTNNPTSVYALHILNHKHEYGTAAETSELLKPCHKGTRMDCWETFYMQTFHKHKILITEQ